MKETGMSLHDMKKYIDLRKQEKPPLNELMDILLEHQEKVRKKLLIYQKNLTILDEKIEVYQQEIQDAEGKDLFDRFVENYDKNSHLPEVSNE